MSYAGKLCNNCWTLNNTRDLVCVNCVTVIADIATTQFEVVKPVDENREGLVSSAHGSTSRKAAKRIKPKTGTQRYAVLAAIARRRWYGTTRDDLAMALGMRPNSLRPRVRELLLDGYIEVMGTTQAADDRDLELLGPTRKGLDALQ